MLANTTRKLILKKESKQRKNMITLKKMTQKEILDYIEFSIAQSTKKSPEFRGFLNSAKQIIS